MYLKDSFIKEYKDKKPPFGPLGEFVYYRTYSRWLDGEKRREHWYETVRRVVEYSMKFYTGPASYEVLRIEAENLYDQMFNLKGFTSGRTLWVGGTEAAEKTKTANFNCAGLVVDNYQSFSDLFYLLLVGSGVGFRVLPTDVSKLQPINDKISLANKPYNGKQPEERIENTMSFEEDGCYYIVVGDSKQGWVESLTEYLKALQRKDVETIIINYDSVRPRGEPLKTFGGRSSGHQALRDMFKYIHRVLKHQGDNLTTVQCMDICNIIGYHVVVGGVRRTSEICLFSPYDESILNAKKDLFTEGSENFGKFWRVMSNNTIFFEEKPDREFLASVFNNIKQNGEPGILNASAARKRRPWFDTINPCAEILLSDKGFCNLVDLNVAYCENDMEGFEDTIRLFTRHNLRLTNIDLELKDWDKNQKRDRLLGIGMFGLTDFFEEFNIDTEGEEDFYKRSREIVQDEIEKYCFEMRVPTPLLATTIKPGGTIPQLPTVSSGCHRSFAPYFIRRVRINSSDPLAKAVLNSGYPVFPESNTKVSKEKFEHLSPFEKMKVLNESSTWVVEFPVKSKATKTANEESAIEQLERYFRLQKNWTDHNTSITVYVDSSEWEDVTDFIYENWEDYIAVSFLEKDCNFYELMPYEQISEEEYHQRISEIKTDVDIYQIMNEIENGSYTESDLLEDGCESGVCPVR